MIPTTASTRRARSSQVRSTDRRAGVSMAEVVMDDMAIGDPASLLPQLWRAWASFPGIHIAQFHFQVIGNCGVISLMQCSNDGLSRASRARSRAGVMGYGRELDPLREPLRQLSVGDAHNMTVSWRRRPARISGVARG